MNITGIIPARMDSSRFPGKPLAVICDRAMIYHVYHRSKMARVLDEIYIATCDKKIKDYCEKNNMNVIMTKNTHQMASDRASEAMKKIEKEKNKKIDIVVMIQGDEPMVFPEMIGLSLKPMLEDSAVSVVNLVSPVKNEKEAEDSNAVKVVFDKGGNALYFSRDPIPSGRKTKKTPIRYKQVPIIPFRRDFLIKFNELSRTPLEIVESVDMLRLLEHGYKVKTAVSEFITYGVDTPGDLKRVEGLMKDDPLISRYREGKQ